MRIAVTGGTGFIGAALCGRLIAAGHDVSVLTRRAPAQEGIALVAGDLTDPSSLRQWLEVFQPQAVMHLAAAIPESGPPITPQALIRANSEGTYSLLEACSKIQSCSMFLYASTMSVYPYEHPHYVPVDEVHPVQPSDSYGLSKYFGENAISFFATRSQLACRILRLSGVFGLGKQKGIVYNCLRAALPGGRTVTLSNGDIRRDLISVEDVVEAFLLALRAVEPGPARIYNIGSGMGLSPREVCEIVERITGRTLLKEFIGPHRDSEFYFSLRKAKQELAYQPATQESRIAQFWESLRNE